ncbi:hypothetical protein QQS21_005372 [Conoideocrella luteorostrata]|uniref:PX-associated-domain-containing protein n=1 Tax=Conoideocrella luteorostrata TaxID=1105319 RepID=A0AAJ0G0Z7_9HYPO|nr:hypothetical protein QQS21_005372 [Conoideocrella luteorostrata]
MAEEAAASTPPVGLSAEQIRALFDILTHYETYKEITNFKTPEATANYGFPFKKSTTALPTPTSTAPSTPPLSTSSTPSASSDAAKRSSGSASGLGGGDDKDEALSSSPILQMLLTRTVLLLPGVSNFTRDFWSVRVQTLLARLGEAELSESYDKGALGTRKVLATGCSALIEMLGRGMLGGVDKRDPDAGVKTKYDHGSAEDIESAWDDITQGLVYGDLVDQLFDHFIKTDDLESLSPTVEISVKHNVYHIATLVHQIFVLSPEGPYLLKLIENVNSLVPYKLIKQTLRIGNAASMIKGMMRILLAKLSLTSVTNWFGLTQNEDDGMNLLQQIISAVLSWDSAEFKKNVERVETAKDGPSKEMLRTIKEHIQASKSEHHAVRLASEQNAHSIITAIFNVSNPHLNTQLTESQHSYCLEYYSSLLSVRDRDCITSAFCRQPPDMFTQSMKDLVAAYDPIIRTVHSHIDLRIHFDSLQGFIEAFIKTSKPKKGSASRLSSEQTTSVDDYVGLLMEHRGLLFKWIHALASQCPDIWENLRRWSNNAIVKFRKRAADTGSDKPTGSGAIPPILDKLYHGLDSKTQKEVIGAIDAHAAYLSTLNDLSRARMQYLVTASDSSGGATRGPGVYLARWQALLDETLITPSQSQGPVRHGKDVKHITTMGKTGAGGKKLEGDGTAQKTEVEAPGVQVVTDALGTEFFREIQLLASKI